MIHLIICYIITFLSENRLYSVTILVIIRTVGKAEMNVMTGLNFVETVLC